MPNKSLSNYLLKKLIKLLYTLIIGNFTNLVKTNLNFLRASALTDSSAFNFFRGCIEEVRVAGVLLPFYTEAELVNSTAAMKFVAEAVPDVARVCKVI